MFTSNHIMFKHQNEKRLLAIVILFIMSTDNFNEGLILPILLY